MNIRVHLSEVTGSNETDIEQIERWIIKRQPFGLKCHRSMVVFIPAQFRAYWIWSDRERGPTFNFIDLAAFVNGVKMQYLAHKELVTTDELLGIAKLLKYEQQQNRVGLLRSAVLPEPGQPPGSLETSPGGM